MKKIADYKTLLQQLKDLFIQQVEFTSEPDLEAILRNPRLIVVLNHSTPLSWIPAISTLGLKFIEKGGGDRVPRGIADKWFYSNPLSAKFAEFFTQSAHLQNFEQIMESFKASERSDLVLFPEGANSFFGDVSQIQDFRSYRFVELSIRTQSPILIVSHKGSEHWSTSLQLPSIVGDWLKPLAPFFGKKIAEHGAINLPMSFAKIQKFKMHCHLYVPALYESDLSSDQTERKSQLEAEARLIQEIMAEGLQ